MTVRAWPLPLAAGLLALFTIHLCYVIAAAHGHVPWCLPWLDSCTSISATGRQLPEKLLFRPLMMIDALLVAATLWLAGYWLRDLGDNALRTQRVLGWCGVLAALCIVFYTGALGEAGDQARLMRRIGVTLGFALTFLGELLLLARIAALRRRQPARIPAGPFRTLYGLMALFLVLGVTSVLLSAFYDGYRYMDDAFEWVFALLLNLYLVALALVWRRTGFRVSFGSTG